MKINTFTIILSLWLVSLSSLSAQSKAGDYRGSKEDLHIYLLIGQSNMAGRAPYNQSESGPISRCYLLDDQNQWEIAKNPLNRYSTIRKSLSMQKMNLGYSFAKTLLNKNKNISIGLVVNAKGGSKIEEWKKGSKFYNEAIKRTKAAQKTGTLKGILWHQGESNSEKPTGYLKKLTAFVTNLRKDLNSPNLPFVAGQIHNAQKINDIIAQLPEKLPHTGVVSSEGLKAMDKWHFDAKSMTLLGDRYAEEISKLRAKEK